MVITWSVPRSTYTKGCAHLRYSEQTALFDGLAEVADWRTFQLLDQPPLKTVDATHPKRDWQYCTHNPEQDGNHGQFSVVLFASAAKPLTEPRMLRFQQKPGGSASLDRRAVGDSRLPIVPTAATEAAVIVPVSPMEEPATTSRMRPDNDNALGFRRRRRRQKRAAQKCGCKD
jgi:hypothetical protein